MDRKDKNQSKDTAQEILKKIESESAEQKKAKAYDILQGKAKAGAPTIGGTGLFGGFKKLYSQKQQEIVRKWRSPENQKAIWMTGFLVVSTFICWQIERKFDIMKKKASSTKTYKEAQIERQNLEINKYLSKNEFEAIPIREEPQIKNTYKYQEEEGYFDTKDYLLEQIAREYKQGHSVEPEMLKQLQDKGFI